MPQSPSNAPLLPTKQHEQHESDGGVMDTLTASQSATAALLLPFTVQLKLAPHPLPQVIETVPAPTAVNENPEPYKQQPDVLTVMLTLLQGTEQPEVVARAKTLSGSTSPGAGNPKLKFGKSGKSGMPVGLMSAGIAPEQSHPLGYVPMSVPHK